MFEHLAALVTDGAISAGTLAISGIGLGVFIAVLGLFSALAPKDPVLQRMARNSGPRVSSSADKGLLRPVNADPTGLMKSLVPVDRKERTEIQRQLAIAGLTGPTVVRNYYLTRVFLGLVFPGALLALIAAVRAGAVHLPAGPDAFIVGLSQLNIFQIVTILVAIGFFGPAYWLKARANERKMQIEESFPNALDLIQISVEAGLGFDAAMIRVGNELEHTAPAIATEILTAEREIQAGRSRERALLDMAARTGVSEVVSFANVVLQSIQFGTSISETLTTYASEMRVHRELRAQEKANKLPVQMSAIMASLMLPALLLLTLGPVVIRYVRQFN